MTRNELYSLNRGIVACANLSNNNTIEFSYRLAIIQEDVEKMIRDIEKLRPKATDDYKAYLIASDKILHEYAIKNENGTYLTTKTGVAISNPVKFDEEINLLKEKYKDVIIEHETLTSDFTKFLEKDSEFKFEPIPKKYIPFSITPAQMKGILPIVEKSK
jgi:hypothetical protein